MWASKVRTSEAFFLSCRPVPTVAELDEKIHEFEPAVCKLDGRVRKLTLLRWKSVNSAVQKCQFWGRKVSISYCKSVNFPSRNWHFFQVTGKSCNADSRFGYGNMRFARCSSLASMDFVRICSEVRSVCGKISIGEVFYVGNSDEKIGIEMLKV